MKQNYLALDLGASSGRAVIGTYDGERITLTEIHRFANEPVRLCGTLYWDVLRLVHEIKASIRKAKPYDIRGIGIDTWGVDFGLLDSAGTLMGNPVHYRDVRTNGILNDAFTLISPQELYAATGNQIMEINTAFQIYAMLNRTPGTLAFAEHLLLIPDLLNYFLTGERGAERSIASTTQLYDPQTGDWNFEIVGMFGAQERLLPPITESGTLRGMLSEALCRELQTDPIPVYAVCGHDTQSAMAAVPAQEEQFAFLSCGTWSLLGTERSAPILTEEARTAAFTNESGFGGKTAFLKNLTGLWIMQESRRQCGREGRSYSFAEIEQMARDHGRSASIVDTEDPRFASDGDLPQMIRDHCAETGQPVPQTDAAVFRCIYDSLAEKYRETLHDLHRVTGFVPERLYVVGGGTKDPLLMELTAKACGIPVLACGTEGSALGNIAVQLAAAGQLNGLADIRAVCARSQTIREYQ